jgi:hypothetical protein
MRFALTVPPGAVPVSGYPLCIYSHGTGGDFESFIDDGTARALALQGIAVISTDQVLHGPRNPAGNPEVDFFNFANPFAGRDNSLQGAADAWSQMRLAQGMSFVDGVRTITFDPTKIYFFGHSGRTDRTSFVVRPSLGRVPAPAASSAGCSTSAPVPIRWSRALSTSRPAGDPSLALTAVGNAPTASTTRR